MSLVHSDVELLKVPHGCKTTKAFRGGLVPIPPWYSESADEMPVPWPAEVRKVSDFCYDVELEVIPSVEERRSFFFDFARYLKERRHRAWAPPATPIDSNKLRVSLEADGLLLR